MIDTLVAWGDADALAKRVDAYRDAGSNRIMVIPFGGFGDGDTLSVLAARN